jgi:hypothetical protein
MATMKAITAGGGFDVQSKLVRTMYWLKELRSIYQPGDRIVCHQEQTVKNGFLKTVPASMFLHDVLHYPIITISDFYHPQQDQLMRWIRASVAWVGFILILAGFTALEIRLDSLTSGAYGKVLLFIILLIEVGAIWAWNLITG